MSVPRPAFGVAMLTLLRLPFQLGSGLANGFAALSPCALPTLEKRNSCAAIGFNDGKIPVYCTKYKIRCPLDLATVLTDC
jgi:hypothetical protein